MGKLYFVSAVAFLITSSLRFDLALDRYQDRKTAYSQEIKKNGLVNVKFYAGTGTLSLICGGLCFASYFLEKKEKQLKESKLEEKVD